MCSGSRGLCGLAEVDRWSLTVFGFRGPFSLHVTQVAGRSADLLKLKLAPERVALFRITLGALGDIVAVGGPSMAPTEGAACRQAGRSPRADSPALRPTPERAPVWGVNIVAFLRRGMAGAYKADVGSAS